MIFLRTDRASTTALGMIAFATLATSIAVAQAPPVPSGQSASTELRFEAASIKPSPKEPALGIAPNSPDRFSRANITLINLMNYAWDMRAFRIVGGPDWVSTLRWDVSAKAERATPPTEMRLLVQRLLRERFALETHIEAREQQIYELVKVRDDGRLGPNLKPAEFDCEPVYAGQRPRSDVPADARTGFPRCNTSFLTGSGVTTARLNGHSMARFAVFLQPTLERFVVDKTGLAGSFDVELTYQDERLMLPGNKPKEGPALMTALPEQLGLRLQSTRGPVDVLVIDRVERPTPD